MRYGHFDTAADEYVVERPDVPVSWTNYLGTRDYCAVLSHHGGGYSYYKSPQTGRITRFRQNGVPLDRPGHYIYLRDNADGDYWSVSWQPVGKPLAVDGATYDPAAPAASAMAEYQTRHGLGYTTFESRYRGIEASQTIFVPLDDAAEVWDVRLANTSDRVRELTVASYVEFSFHTITIDNQNLQMSLYASGSSYADGIIEYDLYYEPWTYHFFASSRTPDSYDCLRENFIGPYRTETDPVAVEIGHGSDTSATTQNHCGALFHTITLQPGETARLSYVLGYGGRAVGQEMRAKYADMATVDGERARLAAHWAAKQDKLRIRTPHEGMNAMINTWTLLQAETCVTWSRFASFVEVGGRTGLGYRDTAQDVMSVIHSNPAKTRQRLVELLRAQVAEGYGLHLFDPKAFDPDAEKPEEDIPSPTIIPTKDTDFIHGLGDACSDDHLWLVPSVVEYVKETGDLGFLDEVIPFADGAPATVYQHLVAAIDFTSRQVGPNGVALGLRADWNDCLNLGGGETALVTFLHAWAIRALLEVAEPLAAGGRPDWPAGSCAFGRRAHRAEMADDVARLRAELARLTRVAEDLWDGRWWIRGFTRYGVKIGTHHAPEGKIFLEHQSWPIIGGITTPERGRVAMDAVRELLVSPYGNHLNWPAYTKKDDTIGFVTRVYPGIKENAAIFSHPNAWPIIAEAILGRGDEAVAFYDAMLPYRQNDMIEIRKAEPYAYCQFVYGRDHEWYGLAQNPWLTGTAGWMYTAVTKYILGVRLALDGLVVDPSIPRDWDGFEVRREWRGAVYEIEVRNPGHVSRGVASVTLAEVGDDGQEGDAVGHDPATPIPARPAGTTTKVVVTLG